MKRKQQEEEATIALLQSIVPFLNRIWSWWRTYFTNLEK